MQRSQRLKTRPSHLAIAAALLVSACAPTTHTDAVIGGGADTMLRVGDAARDAGDIGAAIPIYRRAHALAPLESAPLLRLANSLHTIGAYREAGNAWDRILRLESKNFEARVGYGETLLALGQPILALEEFNLPSKHGKNAKMYNGVGLANDMLGKPKLAQAAYREGLQKARTANLLNNIGLSLALSGESEDAIALLEETAKTSATGPQHRSNLALAYLVSGNSGRAAELLARDMDDVSMIRTIAFYETIIALPDHARKVAAMGASGQRKTALSTQNARAAR